MVRISLPLEETWSSIYLHAIRVDVWGGLYINSSLTIIIIRNGGCSDLVVFQIQFGCDVQFLQPLLGLTTLINMSIMVMIKNMVYMQPRVKDDSHTNCVIWKSLIDFSSDVLICFAKPSSMHSIRKDYSHLPVDFVLTKTDMWICW